jgi:hypothetical protein
MRSKPAGADLVSAEPSSTRLNSLDARDTCALRHPRSRVKRKRFEHFHVELSVALGRLVPRYELWLFMSAQGCHPEGIERTALLAFFDEHLDEFLDPKESPLEERPRLKLRRTLARFDPIHPTPYEFMERISSAFG